MDGDNPVRYLAIFLLLAGCSPREWYRLLVDEVHTTPGFEIRVANESSGEITERDLLQIDTEYAMELECWWASQGTRQYVDPKAFVLVIRDEDLTAPVWDAIGCRPYVGGDGSYYGKPVKYIQTMGGDNVIYTTMCGVWRGVLRHEFGHYICYALRGFFAEECGDQDRTHELFNQERNGCRPRQ